MFFPFLFGVVALVLKHMLENKVFVLDLFCGVALVLKHMLENKVFVLLESVCLFLWGPPCSQACA